MGFLGVLSVGLATLALVASDPQGFNFQMGDPDFADIGVGPSSGPSPSLRGNKISSGGSNRPSYVVRETNRPSSSSRSPYFRGEEGQGFSSSAPAYSNFGGRPAPSYASRPPPSYSGRPSYESEGDDGPSEGPQGLYGGGFVEESEGPSYDDSPNYVPTGPSSSHPSSPYGGSSHKPSFGHGGPSSSPYYSEDSPAGGRPSFSSGGPPPPGFGGGHQGRYPGGPGGPRGPHPSGSSSFPLRLGRGLMGLLSSASAPHFSITPQYFSPPIKYRAMDAAASKTTAFYLEPPTQNAPYYYGHSAIKPQSDKSPNAPLFRGPRTSSSPAAVSLLTSATTNQVPQDYYNGLSSLSASSSSVRGSSPSVQQLINQVAQSGQTRTPVSQASSSGLRFVGSPTGPAVTGGRPQVASQYSGQTVPNPFATPVLRQQVVPQQQQPQPQQPQQQQQQQLIRATGPDGNPVYYQLQGANSAQNIYSQQPEQYSTIAAISQVQPEQPPQQIQPQQQSYQTINQNQLQSVQPSNFPQGTNPALVSITTQQPSSYNSQAPVQTYQPTQYLQQQQQQQQPTSGASSAASPLSSSGTSAAPNQYVVQQQSQLGDLSQFSFADQSIYQQLLQPQLQQQQVQQQAQQQYTISQQSSSASPSQAQQQQLLLSQLQQAQQAQQQQLQQGVVRQSAPSPLSQDFLIQPAIQTQLTDQQRYQIEGPSGASTSGNAVQYLQQDPLLTYSSSAEAGNQQQSQQYTSSQQPQHQQQYSVLSTATKQ